MDKPLWMWAVFLSVIVVLLILDLGVFQKKDHEIGVRESLIYSAVYILIGLSFGGWIWYTTDSTSAELYWTGYIVEKPLSLDNIFVISMVMTYFSIPRKYEHRILFWGIMGAICLRGIMIGVGAEMVSRFHWVLYIFAIFLVFTGIKMLFVKEEETDISKNLVVIFCRKHFRVTEKLHGNKMIVKLDGFLWFTPLALALVVIEFVDIVFAVDSVPAILALTTDTYLVYTSNIFAILGLRALYFALDAMLHRFAYLKYALSIVLIFIGSKIFIVDFLSMEKFPASASLGITVTILATGILYSLYKTRDSVVTDQKALNL